MSDIARDMLRMFGLGMGLDVRSNQRLAKVRELRQRELDALEAERDDEWLTPPSGDRRRVRVARGTVPWIPSRSQR